MMHLGMMNGMMNMAAASVDPRKIPIQKVTTISACRTAEGLHGTFSTDMPPKLNEMHFSQVTWQVRVQNKKTKPPALSL